MNSKFYIPYFKDGEFLTERELYELVGFSLELHRINSLAKGQIGFFAPGTSDEAWNFFEQSYNYLTIHSLFVISPEGIPVVLTDPQRLELSEVTIDRTTLFASVYLANHSQAFESEHFSPDSYDAEGQPIRNAYQITLHWGIDTAPEIAGTTCYSVEIGRMTGVDSADFRVTPMAYYPAGLPELKAIIEPFISTLDGYTQLLLEPALMPSVDRSSLIERLEQLIQCLKDPFTPTQKSINEAQIMIKAAKGFYLRLAYARDPQNPLYQTCKGLTRRVLEQQLENVFEGGKDPLSEAISAIYQLSTVAPTTGYEQIQFFRELVQGFDLERSKLLFDSLIQQKTPPPPPRQRQEMGGPKIIPLDQKKP